MKMSMYGTQDAAFNWEQEYSGTLVGGDYKRGRASPCILINEETGAKAFVHARATGASKAGHMSSMSSEKTAGGTSISANKAGWTSWLLAP